jgi:hypothetical protein
MFRLYRFLIPVAIAALMVSISCRRGPARTTEVVAVSTGKVPLAPQDPAWERAPEHLARLLPQDQVEPRLMKGSTPEVLVRVLTDGSDVAFRLEWQDPTLDDIAGPGRFVDGCGVQLPKRIEATPPDPQMGSTGHPVEITFWRADWQAVVNGRGDTIRDLYPNVTVDRYPFDAASLDPGSAAQKEMALRYSPARALGNRRSGPREVPVDDMIAEGPGTLTPAPATTSAGQGLRSKNGWTVVLKRRLPADLSPCTRSQVAFAVWEGSHKEVGARKMRTGWIPLLREGEK